MIHLPLDDFGMPADQTYEARELVSGERYFWTGGSQFVRLDPAVETAHIYSSSAFAAGRLCRNGRIGECHSSRPGKKLYYPRDRVLEANDAHEENPSGMPSDDALWFKDAVFYEVPVRSFFDSSGDGKGDFRGLAQKLDYIRDLGVDCIWVLPMYPSPNLDDGYDIADFLKIHPDYGTVSDFILFIDAAHARGLKVVADLVLNHTSDQHAWFQESRSDPNSPKRDYYVWSDDPTKYSGARVIFVDTEQSNWSFDQVAGQYFWHRFFYHQPDLNFENPAVQEEMLDVARYWLNFGLDGFRCDAVPYLYEREGTNCKTCPKLTRSCRNSAKWSTPNSPVRFCSPRPTSGPKMWWSISGPPRILNSRWDFIFP